MIILMIIRVIVGMVVIIMKVVDNINTIEEDGNEGR